MQDFIQVEVLAKKLIQQWIPGWKFAWNAKKRCLGECDYKTHTIFLSRAYCEILPEYEIRETILHEIAHALTPSHCQPHGKEWKANARRVGCVPRASAPRNLPKPKGKWNLVCTGCEKIVQEGRHRRSNMRGKIHSKCPAEVQGAPLVWRERVS